VRRTSSDGAIKGALVLRGNSNLSPKKKQGGRHLFTSRACPIFGNKRIRHRSALSTSRHAGVAEGNPIMLPRKRRTFRGGRFLRPRFPASHLKPTSAASHARGELGSLTAGRLTLAENFRHRGPRNRVHGARSTPSWPRGGPRQPLHRPAGNPAAAYSSSHLGVGPGWTHHHENLGPAGPRGEAQLRKPGPGMPAPAVVSGTPRPRTPHPGHHAGGPVPPTRNWRGRRLVNSIETQGRLELSCVRLLGRWSVFVDGFNITLAGRGQGAEGKGQVRGKNISG